MADVLVKATLAKSYVVNGVYYEKGDEVEVYPHEERWLRHLGVAEGSLEEGEQLGGPHYLEGLSDEEVEEHVEPGGATAGVEQPKSAEAPRASKASRK